MNPPSPPLYTFLHPLFRVDVHVRHDLSQLTYCAPNFLAITDCTKQVFTHHLLRDPQLAGYFCLAQRFVEVQVVDPILRTA